MPLTYCDAYHLRSDSQLISETTPNNAIDDRLYNLLSMVKHIQSTWTVLQAKTLRIASGTIGNSKLADNQLSPGNIVR